MRLECLHALNTINAMSGDKDAWDFKASYDDGVSSTWLGGPVGCQTNSHTIYWRNPRQSHSTGTTPPTGAATSRPRTSATSALTRAASVAFVAARCVSQQDARYRATLIDSGRQGEVHDQAMIKGVKLYDRWGYRSAARRCFVRPRS